MVESDEATRDIREIKWHLEAIDCSMELLTKANKDNILAEIMSFFGKSKRKAEVFLAVNEKRTVDDITELLQMKESNVSRELTSLKNEGLIELWKLTSEGHRIYRKRKVDRILGISRILKQEFGINDM
ncbi:MAG: MarR family transcriptional regulator [Theionarchaea archaeon]|nr:MarR family transcriptional regulator [Theionarchaea archaeon]